jgi:hypothetical protein
MFAGGGDAAAVGELLNEGDLAFRCPTIVPAPENYRLEVSGDLPLTAVLACPPDRLCASFQTVVAGADGDGGEWDEGFVLGHLGLQEEGGEAVISCRGL